MTGWIKLSRSITDNPIYFGERFSLGQCWIDLILLAEWKEQRSFFVRGNEVSLKRGQLAISIRDLAHRWSMSTNTVQRKLRQLEEGGRITVQRSHTINVITVLDYDKLTCPEDNTSFDTQTDTQTQNTLSIDTQNDTQSDTQSDTQTQNTLSIDTQTDTQIDTQTDTQTQKTASIDTLPLTKKENKNNKNIYISSPPYSPPTADKPAQAQEEGEGADKAFLDWFFAGNRQASLEQFCMHQHISAKCRSQPRPAPASTTGGTKLPTNGATTPDTEHSWCCYQTKN